MRVLMINSFFSVGGPPRIMNGIYMTLKENGDECKLAAAREKEYAPEDSIPIGNTVNIYCNAFSARLLDNDGMSAKMATRKLIRSIEQYNPDIIHLHNLHGYYINVEILFEFLKQYGKPVVWTLHDCWAMTGHCCHFDYIECDKWKTACQHCPQLREYPKCLWLDCSQNNYKIKRRNFTNVSNMTIVTVSEWLKGIVEQSYLEKYPVKVIANGVDLDTFHPTDNDIRKKFNMTDKKVLLGVAQNWGVKKGLNDFVQLSKKLDDSYRIVLIGLPSQLAQSMPTNILTISQTNSSNELAKWYSAADIFLNLSYEETFGLVTLEAMACGTPVIVYDRTAVPEIVKPGCGKVVHAGNVDAVLDACNHICKTDYTRFCLQYSQGFDNTIKYHEYLELYKKLINSFKKN